MIESPIRTEEMDIEITSCHFRNILSDSFINAINEQQIMFIMKGCYISQCSVSESVILAPGVTNSVIINDTTFDDFSGSISRQKGLTRGSISITNAAIDSSTLGKPVVNNHQLFDSLNLQLTNFNVTHSIFAGSIYAPPAQPETPDTITLKNLFITHCDMQIQYSQLQVNGLLDISRCATFSLTGSLFHNISDKFNQNLAIIYFGAEKAAPSVTYTLTDLCVSQCTQNPLRWDKLFKFDTQGTFHASLTRCYVDDATSIYDLCTVKDLHVSEYHAGARECPIHEIAGAREEELLTLIMIGTVERKIKKVV